MPAKSLSIIAVIVAIAIVLMRIFKHQKCRRYVLAAIVSGMFGDYFLGLKTDAWQVLVGGLFFTIEHIIFITMFIKLFKQHKLKILNKWFYIGIGIFVLTTIILEILTFTIVNKPIVIVAAILPLYILIICINMSLNFSYSFQRKDTFYLFALGIFIFYISDIFVFLTLLNIAPWASSFIWYFYPVGQLLMVLFVDKLEKPKNQIEAN